VVDFDTYKKTRTLLKLLISSSGLFASATYRAISDLNSAITSGSIKVGDLIIQYAKETADPALEELTKLHAENTARWLAEDALHMNIANGLLIAFGVSTAILSYPYLRSEGRALFEILKNYKLRIPRVAKSYVGSLQSRL